MLIILYLWEPVNMKKILITAHLLRRILYISILLLPIENQDPKILKFFPKDLLLKNIIT